MNVLNLYRHVQVRDEHDHHVTAIGLIASGINCSCMHPVVQWPPSRPSCEDPPLPSRRPACKASGPAPMRAGTDCVWLAERLQLTADRSRNKKAIESPVI
jgi:hypothetical protein